MLKIKCIRDRYGSLIPIDKIEYISKDCWVSAGGSRRGINYNTLVLLLDIFEEIEREEIPVKNTCRRDSASYIDTDTCWDDGNF